MNAIEKLYHEGYMESEEARDKIHKLAYKFDYPEALELIGKAEKEINKLSKYFQKEKIKSSKEF